MPGSVPGQTPGGGWVPIPDPTALTTEAVGWATEQFQREIAALRELHAKDMSWAKETVEARMAGMDQDRARLWEAVSSWQAALSLQLESRRREFSGDLIAARDLIWQRLDDLDKAVKLAAEGLKQQPEHDREARVRLCTDFTRQLASEREYVLSQLEIIATRMGERFAAIDGQFAASKTAVDAALSAAKEAVAEQNKANSAAIKVSEGNTKEQLTSLGQVSGANFQAMGDKIDDARNRLTTMESLTRGIKEASGEDRADRGLQHGSVQLALFSVSLLLSLVAVIITIVLHK